MNSVFAIDPGPEQSAFVCWNGTVEDCGIVQNAILMEFLRSRISALASEVIACEMIASYGMPVGKEVFETCVWVGRFMERSKRPFRLVYRKDVKMHLCHSMRAKDANVAQALKDKHGQVGTKKNPGPLFGIKSHLWAALAVADYTIDALNVSPSSLSKEDK